MEGNDGMMDSEHILAIQGRQGRRITIVGAGVNLFLILIKFGAGVLGHSQALIADAVHSISDLFTDAVVLLGIKIGRMAPDEKHPFGHGRFETLASAVVSLTLVGLAVYLGIEAVLNIIDHTEYHPTWLALGAALLSIILKEGIYRYTVKVGRRIKSQALIANAWHHRSDALSSVAVLIGVTGALIRPSWYILDSYAVLIVSFFIIKAGLELLGGAISEFTDTAPKAEVMQRIKNCVQGVRGVEDLHDVKARVSGGRYQLQLHVVVDRTLTVAQGHKISKDVEKCLWDEFEDLGQLIVHVDPTKKGSGKPVS
jgi:cation diffusion facilitator family transporter